MALFDGGVHTLTELPPGQAWEGLTQGPWILASASPRRADLLQAAGVRFEVRSADVDETPIPGEDAGVTAERLSRDKARAVAALVPQGTVLGGDTVVALDGDLLGKPADAEEARRMLRRLSGRTHEVISGAALCDAATGLVVSGRHVSEVRFHDLDEAQLQAYLSGGEWDGKAGAYAIQGEAAAFATLLQGHLDTVIGLSVTLVRELAAALSESVAEASAAGRDSSPQATQAEQEPS